MNDLLFALLGAMVGSFTACFAWREAMGLSQTGRSFCAACGHTLGAKDLVPIFGFLCNKGRCRYCRARIPRELPLGEGLAALAFAVIPCYTLDPSQRLWLGVLVTMLLLIAFEDLYTHTVSDVYQLLFFLLIVVHWLMGWGDGAGSRIAAAVFLALPVLLLARLRPGHLGSGDVIFVANIGLLHGLETAAYAFSIGIFAALLAALYALLFKGAGRKTVLPLLPFLTFGTYAAFFLPFVH